MHIDRSIVGIRFWFRLIFFVRFSPLSFFSRFPLFPTLFPPLSFSRSLSCFLPSWILLLNLSIYIFFAPCQSSRNVVTTFIKLCGRAKFLRSLKFIRTRFIGIARKIGNRKCYSRYLILLDITKESESFARINAVKFENTDAILTAAFSGFKRTSWNGHETKYCKGNFRFRNFRNDLCRVSKFNFLEVGKTNKNEHTLSFRKYTIFTVS